MKIYRYHNEPEAQKIKTLLGAENIPCQLHSFETWGLDGIFRAEMGMGEVIVPDEFANKAKQIIDELKKHRGDKV